MSYTEKQQKTIQTSRILQLQVINYVHNNPHNTDQLKDQWFLDDRLRKLFNLIKDSQTNDFALHNKVVSHKLSDEFTESMEVLVLSSEVPNLVKSLKRCWLEYRLSETLQTHLLKEEEPTRAISNIWQALTELLNGQEIERGDAEYMYELFLKEEKEYSDKKEAGGELIGHSTGIKSFDDAVDGLRNGHLVIVGGYTSAGKTQFVLNIVRHLMKEGVKSSVYSLEMSKVDIFKRMLGLISGFNGSLLLKSQKEEHQEAKRKATDEILKSGLRVHTEKNDLSEILTAMVVERKTQGTEVFVIDYAQLVKAGGTGLYEDMRALAMKLQHFCRTQNVPIILVSQVSNESARAEDSNVIGFKGAGDLAASADVAIELVSADTKEDREYKMNSGEPTLVNMMVKKNRHGRIFTQELEFQPSTGAFNQAVDNFFN